MKEVIINGVVYVPKIKEEKRLITDLSHLTILSEVGYIKLNAYKEVLKICAYLNNEFKSDGCKWIIPYTLEEPYFTESTFSTIYFFTSKEAAEYALLHFEETFKTFYS